MCHVLPQATGTRSPVTFQGPLVFKRSTYQFRRRIQIPLLAAGSICSCCLSEKYLWMKYMIKDCIICPCTSVCLFPNSQRVLECDLFSKTKMVTRICFKICNLQDNVQHDTSFCTQMGAIPSNQETGYEYKVRAHTSMPAGSRK